jgi:hypothetical protein
MAATASNGTAMYLALTATPAAPIFHIGFGLTDWGRVEEIQIDAFASEHTNLLACVGDEYTDPDDESLVIDQLMCATG